MSECILCKGKEGIFYETHPSCLENLIIEKVKLQAKLYEAVEVIEHYAGEPFETNDIYLDIFDLIKQKGSVTEFDEATFAKRAREFMNKLENKDE